MPERTRLSLYTVDIDTIDGNDMAVAILVDPETGAEYELLVQISDDWENPTYAQQSS